MSKGLIYCMGDTDGLKFCKPDMSFISQEELVVLTDEINSMLEELIILEPDGYFEEIAIIKTKNYVTSENGKIKLKGSSLTDSKKEPALREMVKKIAHSIIGGINYTELVDIYQNYIRESCAVQDITRWAVKKTVTKPVLDSATNPESRTNEKKVWAAIEHLNPQEGDKVYVYDAIDGEKQDVRKGELVYLKNGDPKMVPNKILKTVCQYDNDTISEKLVKRVFDTIKIFQTVVDIDQFPNYALKRNVGELDELTNS